MGISDKCIHFKHKYVPCNIWDLLTLKVIYGLSKIQIYLRVLYFIGQKSLEMNFWDTELFVI